MFDEQGVFDEGIGVLVVVERRVPPSYLVCRDVIGWFVGLGGQATV